MKEGYRTDEDILKEVAEEEGMSFREINDLWSHQKKYIKKLMDEEGVYSIFTPYIGTLSLNVKQFHKESNKRTRLKNKQFTDKVAELEKHENYSLYENAHKRVTGVNRLARYVIRNYHTGIEKSRRILVHTKCWDVIARYSNDMFEKRDKIIKNKKREYNKKII